MTLLDHFSFSSVTLRYIIFIAALSLGSASITFILLLISLFILSIILEECSDLLMLSGYWKYLKRYPSFLSRLYTGLGYLEDHLSLNLLNLSIAESFVSDTNIALRSRSISFLSDSRTSDSRFLLACIVHSWKKALEISFRISSSYSQFNFDPFPHAEIDLRWILLRGRTCLHNHQYF